MSVEIIFNLFYEAIHRSVCISTTNNEIIFESVKNTENTVIGDNSSPIIDWNKVTDHNNLSYLNYLNLGTFYSKIYWNIKNVFFKAK